MVGYGNGQVCRGRSYLNMKNEEEMTKVHLIRTGKYL